MEYWKIPFVSKGGTSYEIQIGGADTNRVLVGGATPIITQEENSDDFFKPVRTQSGYVQIVDQLVSGNRTFSWEEIMPADAVSRPVYLVQGSDVVWRGYLQPQSFSGQWKEAVQIRQYPIVCALSALAAFDVEPGAYTVVNFGGLLHYIFNKLQAWDNTRFWFAGTDAVTEWLYKKAQWSNFVEIGDDNVESGKYNCLELLEHVCRFLGWSCRMCGNDVFFCTPDNEYVTDWSYITLDDLEDIGNGTTITYNTASWSQYSDITSKFADNNNQLVFLRGWKRAKVTANINKSDTTVIDFPPDSLRKTLSRMSYSRQIAGSDKYYFITGNLFSFTSRDINGSGQGTAADPIGTFNAIERYEGNLLAREEANWGMDICIHKSYNVNDTCAMLQTNRAHTYPAGKLTMHADIYRGWDKLSDKCTMVMRVGIGYSRATAKWFDGASWVSSISTFNVKIGDTAGIYHESPVFGTGDGATIPTMHIPIPSVMMGYVYVDFLGSQDVAFDNDGQRSFQIENFGIDFVANANNEDAQNVYEVAGGAFTDEMSVDTIFASDKDNQAGDGLILNTDNTYCEELTYSMLNGGTMTLHPEYMLASRMAEFGRYTKRMYELHLRSNLLPDITPAYIITIDSERCWPMVISRDWREDKTTFKIIQLWQ